MSPTRDILPTHDHINVLMRDRATFDSYTYYRPLKAIAEFERRRRNTALQAYVRSQLPVGLPEPLKKGRKMVLFRHIATPNYEVRRFFAVANAFPRFKPVVLEYTEDKFTNRNEWKYSLGRLRFHNDFAHDGTPIIETVNIIDFNKSNGTPISSVTTSDGRSLIKFHHDFFAREIPGYASSTYDLSQWLHGSGSSAKEYYKPFLALFLRDAILFENFLLDGKEASFTRDIVLPTLKSLSAESGHRPMIIQLEPPDVEMDKIWFAHPAASRPSIELVS